MEEFYKLKNTIRDYAWGHERYIPDFIGLDYPEGKPAAELWMGAHPSAPSRIRDTEGSEKGLDEWISSHGVEALGAAVTKQYGGLPFLFKLLAAGKSLSIQAHPDKKTAEEGFKREESQGIPRNAPNRNYRDDNHKPEIIMAITPFTAMIGFRKPVDILRDLKPLFSTQTLPPFLDALKHYDDKVAWEKGEKTEKKAGSEHETVPALKDFLTGLLTLDSSEKVKIIEAATALVADIEAGDSPCPWDNLRREWVPKLIRQFPGDIGVLAPLFLNIVEIAPGEALYQPARMLHAYLDGFGLELMANSDNVLRGGLTVKNIDIPELVSVLDFHPSVPEIMSRPVEEEGQIGCYPTPAKEFTLGLADVEINGKSVNLNEKTGPAILLVVEGSVVLSGSGKTISLERGESVFVPWCSSSLTVEGKGGIAIAVVPRNDE